jgi:Fe(3+) dicitrate transport protein
MVLKRCLTGVLVKHSLNKTKILSGTLSNIAITDSKYIKSDAPNIEGNKVEFVPLFNIKTGTGIAIKKLLTSVQFSCIIAIYRSK